MQTTTVHIIWQAALTWLLQDRHLVFYQQGASGVNPTIIGGHHPATHTHAAPECYCNHARCVLTC